jgi:hypothetical protein
MSESALDYRERMTGLETLAAAHDASAGTDWAAIFAGAAALTGILAIAMTFVGQSR